MKQYLIFIFLLTALSSSGQSLNTITYLSAHQTTLNDKINDNNPVFDSSFYKHQLFLVGEIHGIKNGQDLDYLMLTLLNKKAGITNYVAEFDFSKAYYLNKYLFSGDESLIDSVFSDWAEQNAQWANKDFQAKIKKIRAYNLGLKPTQRIHFEGIDQIQNPLLVARYFQEILKGRLYHKISPSFAPLLVALNLKNDSLIVKAAQKLINELKKNGKFDLTDKRNKDLLFALNNCTLIQKSREWTITDNFKNLYQTKNWKDKKLYAFLGFAHILQSKANGSKNSFFANRIENDTTLDLKGKIASIALVYVDSEMTTPTESLPSAWQEKGKRFTTFGQFNHDGPIIKLDGIEDFKAVTKPHTTTIFSLIATGSPYFEKFINIHYIDAMPADQRLLLDENGKVITNYFQYLVLIRNSEATQPILN